jgi:hypothetical protein
MSSPPTRKEPGGRQPDGVSLPHPVTFFLSPQERSKVLTKLRRHDKDRRRALLKALRLEQPGSGT